MAHPACSLETLQRLDATAPGAVQALLDACLGVLLDPVLWTWLLLAMLACGLAGLWIGWLRGRWLAGLLWGAALGPVGWLVTGLLPVRGPACPACSRPNPPAVRSCRHCRASLGQAVERSARSERRAVERSGRW